MPAPTASTPVHLAVRHWVSGRCAGYTCATPPRLAADSYRSKLYIVPLAAAKNQSPLASLRHDLEQALLQTDSSFLFRYEPKVNKAVFDIPTVTWAVERLRGKKRKPVPFWNCVVHVDARWSEPRLIGRLNDLLTRAFVILWRSPWTTLRKRFRTKAYVKERSQIESLAEHYSKFHFEPPKDQEHWELFRILGSVHSAFAVP